MSRKKVLVTGADSQLGKTLQARNFLTFDFDFKSKEELDITDKKSVKSYFKNHKIDYCLNFAAYTNVEQAEKDSKRCFKVNKKGVKNLVKAARKHHFKLIHISTDYVFDGLKQKPYKEKDRTRPINVYGKSKRAGEKIIIKNLKKYYIIRTSWLYSAFNRNFVKTILQAVNANQELKLINDQTGTPTYAEDLIDFILYLMRHNRLNNKPAPWGIYHFSNSGKTTWYKFAREILSYTQAEVSLKPVCSFEYPTEALRPVYSVLSKKKIQKKLDCKPRHWKKALKEFIREYKKQ